MNSRAVSPATCVGRTQVSSHFRPQGSVRPEGNRRRHSQRLTEAWAWPRFAGRQSSVGERIWRPNDQNSLARALDAALTHPGVIDLVMFGSQAGGRTTGFSDVDAILVISDEIAGDATEMPSLRRCVLAAQRAVIRYQPMQHHGFEIVTPTLLRDASGALALPAVALAETRSLRGHAHRCVRPQRPERHMPAPPYEQSHVRFSPPSRGQDIRGRCTD